MRTGITETLLTSGMVVLAVTLIQLGSAASHSLFASFGPVGVLVLRSFFSGAILSFGQRTSLRRALSKDPKGIILFGLCMALQNAAFLMSIERIPLGIAVSIEFCGPILMALAGSRRAAEIFWIVFAGAGIAILSPEIGGKLDLVGVLLACVAGVGWAGFIAMSKRLGKTVGPSGALPLALLFGCVLLTPFVYPHLLQAMAVNPGGVGIAACIALFSSAIPLSLEYKALQTLPAQNYGVLVAAEPVVATIIGLAFLGDHVTFAAWIAVALITTASVGMTITSRASGPVGSEAL